MKRISIDIVAAKVALAIYLLLSVINASEDLKDVFLTLFKELIKKEA